MYVGTIILVAVVVVVLIGYPLCSKEFQYDLGYKRGQRDAKKRCGSKYQIIRHDQRNDIKLGTYKRAYINGYNVIANATK